MFGAEKNPKEKSFETATMFHGIPQNTNEHKHTLVFLVDKQFPLELIGAVCLELLCCEAFLLLYTDRLPRRKITLGLLKKPTEVECEGKITDSVESSLNVVVLILAREESYLNEFLTREQ